MSEAKPRADQELKESKGAVAFGVANVICASLVAFSVFSALPSRWWLVDSGAALVIALLGVSGVGLLWSTPWAVATARFASGVVLAIGLLFIAALALTASTLSGLYGTLGHATASAMVGAIALAAPYLVVLPIAELLFLGPAPDAKKLAKSDTSATPSDA